MTNCQKLSACQHLIRLLLDSDDNSEVSTGNRSLYSRLKKYLGEPDESLDPSPVINCLLSELVAHLQGATENDGLYCGQRFSDVERDVCAQIDKHELLHSRANAIRSLAIRAESRLELYWTRSLIQDVSIAHPWMSPIEKVQVGSRDFPYTRNYVSMVQKEAEVIRSHVYRRVGAEDGINDGTASHKDFCIAFCGSGPLPLTGILLAVSMDASVTLIDNDPEAVRLSRLLIENWEMRRIIQPNQVRVVCADGGKVRFFRTAHKYETRQVSSLVKSVQCDVLFVAALIPNATKEEIAENVSEMRHDGPVVVLRTAHGLTARLAYFQIRRHVMTRYLDFIGLVSPIVHDLGNGYIVDDDVRPMGFFSEEILNSLELYQWRKSTSDGS